MPTLDEFIDNLGEPLDFVEYRVDGVDEGQESEYGDAKVDADAIVKQENIANVIVKQENIVGSSGTFYKNIETVESFGSRAGSGSADVTTNVSDYDTREALRLSESPSV
ncbi:hypothetical protein EIP86_001012 [Pleurotus ostreatoroseus]|nr:hypothetical protein EIP86_001012 [Pleurotus ostreatoroseus]